jgi:hypothetical protein
MHQKREKWTKLRILRDRGSKFRRQTQFLKYELKRCLLILLLERSECLRCSRGDQSRSFRKSLLGKVRVDISRDRLH